MNLVKNLLFSLLFFLFLLALSELMLVFFYSYPNGYYVSTPESSFVWKKDTTIIKGITKDAKVQFDQFGARTISKPTSEKIAILAIGGSTTACYSLDQQDTWTALLEGQLGNNYWVGNFGKPGNLSSHHILQLQKLIRYPSLPPIEKIIIMMGKNDFSASIIDEKKYLGLDSFNIQINAFTHLPDSTLPWHRRLRLTKLFKTARHQVIQLYRGKTHGEELLESRKARTLTQEVNQLPNLSTSLSFYLDNAQKMIDFAKTNQIDIVFISQAVLWDKNLNQEDLKLICSNVSEKNIHYSAEALANGMNLFNTQLEELCKRNDIQFIWNSIESNSTNFIDDCHYTELGAKRTAKNIYEGLKLSNLKKTHSNQ